MGISEYIPVAVAGCCAAAVAYVALSQAYEAANEDQEDSEPAGHAGSKSALPDALSQKKPSSQISTASGKPEPVANGSSSSSSNGNIHSPPGECEHCKKTPERQEQLLRCSRCHHAWYCSKDCQRAAWPQHKRSCRRSSSGAANTSSPTAQSSSNSPTAAEAAADGSGDSTSDTANMMDVLKHVLQQRASSTGASDDPLQQQFEQAVLLFVKQEHRAAASALQAVQAAAEASGRLAVAGDCCKWLGHTYLKLGDVGRAAGAFASGCELAEKTGNKRLQVDCLSGMGTMYRDAGQLSAAGGFLRQALRVANALGDEGQRASCLTLLGTVEVATDAAAAISHLEEAVQLREDQVVLLHESGQRGGALASAIMEHAGSLVSLAGAYYVKQRYTDAADAYSKSLAVFEMIEDVDKQVKCLINLANLYELQLDQPDSRAQAADQRRRLYALSSGPPVNRDAPETCAICCEPISPLQATEDKEQQLLLLGCAHCFHFRCWESWSDSHSSTCPSCKQPSPEVAAQQHQQQHSQKAKP